MKQLRKINQRGVKITSLQLKSLVIYLNELRSNTALLYRLLASNYNKN